MGICDPSYRRVLSADCWVPSPPPRTQHSALGTQHFYNPRVSFTRKYLLWLLLPPLAVSILPALLFLAQTIQLSPARALVLAGLLIVTYGSGCVLFTLRIGPYARRVEEALAGEGDLSQAMSHCLDETKKLSLWLWGGGGVLFALIASSLLMRTATGFATFLVAALMAGFISIVWGYAMGKHRLIVAAAGRRVHYQGAVRCRNSPQ